MAGLVYGAAGRRNLLPLLVAGRISHRHVRVQTVQRMVDKQIRREGSGDDLCQGISPGTWLPSSA